MNPYAFTVAKANHDGIRFADIINTKLVLEDTLGK